VETSLDYFCEVMMIHVDLEDREGQILIEVLENALSDLRMEIANTDSMDYREMLKGRKEVIKKAIGSLRAAGATPPAKRDPSLGHPL